MSYIQTYVERDVRLIRNVGDLAAFRRFMRLCAGRVGQLLDLSGIGGDSGVSHNTVRDWVGVLETGFIAFRLEPYHRNFSKRLIKSPKLYFYDTGLLCRLLNIRTSTDLATHPHRGAIFENWCVTEALKGSINRGERPALYFWRDQTFEVDLLMDLPGSGGGSLAAIECKSGATVASDFLDAPAKLAAIAGQSVHVDTAVVYGGAETQIRSRGRIVAWKDFAAAVARGLW